MMNTKGIKIIQFLVLASCIVTLKGAGVVSAPTLFNDSETIYGEEELDLWAAKASEGIYSTAIVFEESGIIDGCGVEVVFSPLDVSCSTRMIVRAGVNVTLANVHLRGFNPLLHITLEVGASLTLDKGVSVSYAEPYRVVAQ